MPGLVPPCPFCQGKILKPIARSKGRAIFQCLGCGLVSAASEIINGQLSPKASARLRTKDYQKLEFIYVIAKKI